MPELPEVETVRQDLLHYVKNKKIKKIFIKPDFTKKIWPSKNKFIRALINETINNILRRGKLLIFDLGKDKKVLAHLKMTGQFVYLGPQKKVVGGGHPIKQECFKPDRFNKVIFDFGDQGKLFYNDIRKFGYLKLVSDQEAQKEIDKFGLEPTDHDFSFEKFNQILDHKKKLAIKKVLLMQDLIAGIGNIYADESCFAAGIRGTRKVENIKLVERKKLYLAVKKILKKAIKYRGTSVNTFIDCQGKKGSYVNFLKVYGQVGKLCQICQKAKIKKVKINGRSTSFCPNCQK